MGKVWVNGCFDVLHRGHFELFKFAKSLGSELIVGVDTDSKVKNDKGHNRPYNNLQDRMFALESIKYIDKIIPFDSNDELEDFISYFSPEILVVGSDWKHKSVVGAEYANRVIFFERITQYSTTKILENAKNK
jgi:rfaE bifunctional protein nucleotidyltransferase chain/domain|tara:strand:+ start:304 stop:702 length:399 start_codon:yes stop_codon:yes gene_type:complete